MLCRGSSNSTIRNNSCHFASSRKGSTFKAKPAGSVMAVLERGGEKGKKERKNRFNLRFLKTNMFVSLLFFITLTDWSSFTVKLISFLLVGNFILYRRVMMKKLFYFKVLTAHSHSQHTNFEVNRCLFSFGATAPVLALLPLLK